MLWCHSKDTVDKVILYSTRFDTITLITWRQMRVGLEIPTFNDFK